MAQEDIVQVNLITRPKQPIGVGDKIVRGGLWSLSGQATIILTSLLATPFVIRFLGPEKYGVFALINLLTNYLLFSELGMGVASTKFGSEAYAEGNKEEEISIFWTSLLIGLVPTTAVALILNLAATPLVTYILNVPDYLQTNAAWAIRIAAWGFVARAVSGIANTPQLVRLRSDIFTLINTASLIAQICLVPAAIFLSDEGLIAAIIVIAVINLITAIIHVYVSSSLLQGLLKPRLKLGLVRPLLQFSRGMVVSYLVGIGLGNAERFFLAHYESVRSVAHYSVAQTVVALISTVPITLNQVLLPAFSQMQVEPGRQALQRLYKQCLRTGILLLIPIMFLLAAGAKDFFTLWAGPEYGLESTRIFYIILCGVGFSSIAYIPFYLLTSLGRTGIIARCRLFQLPLYLIFAAALTYRFGVVGASLVWALFSISDAILLFMFAKRITGFPLSLLPDRKLSLVTAVILLVVILVALNIIIIPITVKSLIVVSTLLLYGGLVWSSILQYEEKVWIKTKMQVYLFQLRRYITT